VKFLADENVDEAIVERMRSDGHAVLYVKEMAPSISDDEVIHLAIENLAFVLTADKDFGDLVYRRRMGAHGIILIRLSEVPREDRPAIVALAVEEHADELAQSFTVIGPGAVRIRRYCF